MCGWGGDLPGELGPCPGPVTDIENFKLYTIWSQTQYTVERTVTLMITSCAPRHVHAFCKCSKCYTVCI